MARSSPTAVLTASYQNFPVVHSLGGICRMSRPVLLDFQLDAQMAGGLEEVGHSHDLGFRNKSKHLILLVFTAPNNGEVGRVVAGRSRCATSRRRVCHGPREYPGVIVAGPTSGYCVCAGIAPSIATSTCTVPKACGCVIRMVVGAPRLDS